MSKLLNRDVSAKEALEWTQNLERSFYFEMYSAPGCSINNFLQQSSSLSVPSSTETSYPLAINPAPLWEMFPEIISNSLREGLKSFTKKLKGFENGTIMGLESKTSSPLQVFRGKGGLCDGFSNLYMSGEGSGYSGGIISSATDGINAAMEIIEKCN